MERFRPYSLPEVVSGLLRQKRSPSRRTEVWKRRPILRYGGVEGNCALRPREFESRSAVVYLAVEAVCVGWWRCVVCQTIVVEDLDSSEASAGPFAMTTLNETFQLMERLRTPRIAHRFPAHDLQ